MGRLIGWIERPRHCEALAIYSSESKPQRQHPHRTRTPSAPADTTQRLIMSRTAFPTTTCCCFIPTSRADHRSSPPAPKPLLLRCFSLLLSFSAAARSKPQYTSATAILCRWHLSRWASPVVGVTLNPPNPALGKAGLICLLLLCRLHVCVLQ